jgi:polar amino acid transport system substrate-binding protein
MTTTVSDDIRRDLAPTGQLRAGINFGNPLYTTRDAATGDPRGVALDVMRELARQLGVPLRLVLHPAPGDVAEAADKDTWDVAVLAIEPARAEKITLTPPMTEIEASYVVRNGSPLRDAAEVDKAGIRVAAPARAGYELYLARTLKAATLVRTASFEDSIEALNDGRADVLSGLRPALLESMHLVRDGRLLDGRFMTVNHGLGIPRGRDVGAAWLATFVMDLRSSGFLARSIASHQVIGLDALR